MAVKQLTTDCNSNAALRPLTETARTIRDEGSPGRPLSSFTQLLSFLLIDTGMVSVSGIVGPSGSASDRWLEGQFLRAKQ